MCRPRRGAALGWRRRAEGSLLAGRRGPAARAILTSLSCSPLPRLPPCSPTAYHIWLFLLNQELARSGVGNAPVRTREVGGGGSGGGSGGGVEGADEGGTEDGSSSAGDAAGWRGSSSDAAAAAAAAAGSGAEDWGEEADDDK